MTYRRPRSLFRFNSRAPRGARRTRGCFPQRRLSVSIHAPRVGRDSRRPRSRTRQSFQFTRPAWGATRTIYRHYWNGGVSIHAPRVGRDRCPLCRIVATGVSIHAPRVGRDVDISIGTPGYVVSIHAPRVGRDTEFVGSYVTALVSIHAPRVGRDSSCPLNVQLRERFNSRAPRGARLVLHVPQGMIRVGFNSRAPRGARQQIAGDLRAIRRFQFTRPAWGATRVTVSPRRQVKFQFTRPAWGATGVRADGAQRVDVSIHAPRVGRDSTCTPPTWFRGFQFTRPAWGATRRTPLIR